MTDHYFGNLRWTSILGPSLQPYVTLTGQINHLGRTITASLQFRVDLDAQSFAIHTLKFMGLTQDQKALDRLLADVVEAG